MPTSRGLHGPPLLCAVFCAWCCALVAPWVVARCATAGDALSAASKVAAQSDDNGLLQQIVAVADLGKFDEVERSLKNFGTQKTNSEARVAAVLYAADRAYAHGNRELAITWLNTIDKETFPDFQPILADAQRWCATAADDLTIPSTGLLELAEQHDKTSLAATALQLRAETLAKAKRIDEAVFLYHSTIARFPKSRRAPHCMLAIAQLHYQQQQYREADQWLLKLAESHPNWQGDARLYLVALVRNAQHEPAQARECFVELLKKDAKSALRQDVLIRLAESDMSAGDAKYAACWAEELLEDETCAGELHCRARFVLVRAAVAQKQWKQAEEQCAALIKISNDPDRVLLASFWQAEAIYRGGDREAAFEQFLDLSLTTDKRPDDWAGIVSLRLAQIEAQRQKWSLAIERCETMVRERPDFSRRYEVEYLLGRSLLAQGRFREAREMLLKVIQSEAGKGSETVAMSQWLIGETYFLQKRYAEAVTAYENVMPYEYRQWQAAALLQSAKCCELLDRNDEALTQYERLIQEFDQPTYVAEATKRLGTTRSRVAEAKLKQKNTATR